MTMETFLLLLTSLSIITGLVTEGVKKFLDTSNVKYTSNILVLIIAVFVGGVGTVIYYLSKDVTWTYMNITSIFLMIIANWLGAMIGYDKVIQTIKQLGVM